VDERVKMMRGMWGNMLEGGVEHLMGCVEGIKRWDFFVFVLKIMVI
jgi:hypothetical protein